MKYILLYNPVSGKGKFKRQIPYIKEFFRDKRLELDIYESREPKDLEEKALIFSGDYDVFIVAGGDGTINEVLNGIMKSEKKPTLAVLPSGTANDIGAMLGINKNYKRTLKIITTKNPVLMDVNSINDRYFLYTTAAGIITKISYAVPRIKVKKYGYLAYVTEGAKDIFKNYIMEMEVHHNNGVSKGEYMLALALSSTRVGGRFLNKFSEPSLNDGLLEIRLIKYKKHFKIWKLLTFFLTGGKRNNEDLHIKSDYFKIIVKEDIKWNTDGEEAMSGSVEIKVIKEGLSVFVSDKSRRRFFVQKD